MCAEYTLPTQTQRNCSKFCRGLNLYRKPSRLHCCWYKFIDVPINPAVIRASKKTVVWCLWPVIFRLGPPNNCEITVQFAEWPVKFQSYCFRASKIWKLSRSSALMSSIESPLHWDFLVSASVPQLVQQSASIYTRAHTHTHREIKFLCGFYNKIENRNNKTNIKILNWARKKVFKSVFSFIITF